MFLIDMRKVFEDMGVWLLNVASAVCIVIVNKHLMGSAGLGFGFAVSLSAIHVLLSALIFWIPPLSGKRRKPLSISNAEILATVILGNLSIVSVNLSLMMNPLGFYQVAKVMNIPFVYVAEWLFFGRPMTLPMNIIVTMVVIGVIMVTVTKFSISLITSVGCAVACVGIVSVGTQQILCRFLMKKSKLSASELLLIVGLPQGLSLAMGAPLLDRWLSHQSIFRFQYTPSVLQFICLSCTIAFLLKYSQALVLGRFSALTYQVMGHIKTILVLLGGPLVFGDVVTTNDAIGTVLATTGMVAYGYLNVPRNKQPPKPSQTARCNTRLLGPQRP